MPTGCGPLVGGRGQDERSLHGGGFLLGGLLGAEGVAAMGARGHRFPRDGGPQAAVADIVEGGVVGVGASLGGAGCVEIVLAHAVASCPEVDELKWAEASRPPPLIVLGRLDVDGAGLAA